MMNRILMLLALLLALPASAADLLDQVSQQLAQTSQLRADFSQTRQLAALKKPLQINGKMVFSRDAGVIWQIEKPYRIGYVMTAKGVTELLPDGSQKQRPAGNIPGIGSVEGLFRGILAADRVLLSQHFNASVSGSAAAWTLALQPKSNMLQKALLQITLQGGRFVDSVRIKEVNGDDTLIRFQRVEVAKTLSSDESRLLGAR